MNAKHKLSMGDNILVKLQLDDQKRTMIKKEAVIRTISEDVIGVEFSQVTPSNFNDKAIGFYLMP